MQTVNDVGNEYPQSENIGLNICPECKGKKWYYPDSNIGGSCRVYCETCKGIGKVPKHFTSDPVEDYDDPTEPV